MRCLGLVVMAGDFWGAGAAMVEGRQPRQGAAKARGGEAAEVNYLIKSPQKVFKLIVRF